MDKKSKILLYCVGIAFIASIGTSFYKYVITKNYQIFAEIPCDPTLDNCFVREEEDGTVSHLFKLSRQASNIPLCDPNKEENCQALTCQPNEKNCTISSCSKEELQEGESCSR